MRVGVGIERKRSVERGSEEGMAAPVPGAWTRRSDGGLLQWAGEASGEMLGLSSKEVSVEVREGERGGGLRNQRKEGGGGGRA